MMLSTSMGRLRIIALIEGVSFLVLLGIAMPLKYYAKMPLAVTYVGGIHGALFIMMGLAALQVAVLYRWSLRRFGEVFLASIIPFGTFVLEPSLKREEEARNAPAETVPG